MLCDGVEGAMPAQARAREADSQAHLAHREQQADPGSSKHLQHSMHARPDATAPKPGSAASARRRPSSTREHALLRRVQRLQLLVLRDHAPLQILSRAGCVVHQVPTGFSGPPPRHLHPAAPGKVAAGLVPGTDSFCQASFVHEQQQIQYRSSTAPVLLSRMLPCLFPSSPNLPSALPFSPSSTPSPTPSPSAARTQQAPTWCLGGRKNR